MKRYKWEIIASEEEIETIVRVLNTNNCHNIGFLKKEGYSK